VVAAPELEVLDLPPIQPQLWGEGKRVGHSLRGCCRRSNVGSLAKRWWTAVDPLTGVHTTQGDCRVIACYFFGSGSIKFSPCRMGILHSYLHVGQLIRSWAGLPSPQLL
jgi:hypothetical protein